MDTLRFATALNGTFRIEINETIYSRCACLLDAKQIVPVRPAAMP
jgi:hypothetical protein